jgi:hypothetical protein
MGLDTFVPSIWAGQLLSPLYKALVLGSVVNRDYEGEIRQFGDSVRINEIGDITVGNYAKYGSLSWQELSSAQKILYIDQAKTFSFAVDDIDQAQSKPKVMAEAMNRAAYAIADTIDQHLAGLYTDAGIVLTATTVTTTNALSWVAKFAEELNKKNVPTAGRFLILPPGLVTKLLLQVSGGVSTDAVPKETSPGQIANGFVGNIYGFNILMSNNVQESSAGVYQPLALTRQAISYAGQLTKIAAVQREDYFDEGVKGLYLYGSKVVRPYALATCAATVGV